MGNQMRCRRAEILVSAGLEGNRLRRRLAGLPSISSRYKVSLATEGAARLFPGQFILLHQAEKSVDEMATLEDRNVYPGSIVTATCIQKVLQYFLSQPA